MLSLIGLLGGLGLLIVLTIRGMNLLIAAPLCAIFLAVCNGLSPFPVADGPSLVGNYMEGFSQFVQSWFLMFLLGSLFGKAMEDVGAADSVASFVLGKIGMKHAVLAIVLACAILTYGGVSLFVVAFSVYPMALSLFRAADLPRRFIPGVLSFGSVTFTMTSAGSPEIQNWIPIKYLGTTAYAAWPVSLFVAILMAVTGYFWLSWMLKRATAKGERFHDRDGDPEKPRNAELPHPLLASLPLVIVLVVSFWLHDSLKQNALIISLLSGVVAAWGLNFRHAKRVGAALAEGAGGALIAIGNTAAVVGFGSVAKAAPAFNVIVDYFTHLPGTPLIGAAVAVSVIAGLTGSASGGQAIALPLLAPHYVAAGVNPEQLHRVVAISSGCLDSLPHNGYVVTTIRAICGESHQDAYPAVGALTVIVPLFGLVVAIACFIIA